MRSHSSANARRGAAANMKAHCDTLRRLRGAIRGSKTWTNYNRVLFPSCATIPTHAQHLANECLRGRFPGKFWAIHPSLDLATSDVLFVLAAQEGLG
jgi:hypothetical protein